MSELDLEIHLDGNENKIHFVNVQDVEPILEHNKTLRAMPQKSDWGRHVASIPNVIYMQWFNEAYAKGEVPLRAFGPEMDKVISRKLQDPANKYLLVHDPMNNHHVGWESK